MPPLTRLAVSLLPLLLASARVAAEERPRTSPTFERHVRPILKAHCFECHGEGKKLRGGLDLRLRRLMAEGGDSGPAVVAGKRDASPLYRRVHAHEMPPGKVKLTGQEIDVIARWIDAGAPTVAAEPKSLAPGLHITDEERAFWAFQPIRRLPSPPSSRPPVSATRSTLSCWRASKRRASVSPRRPTATPLSAGPRSTCSACRRLPNSWPASSPTAPPGPTRISSTACSPRPTTASAGAATGSTWRATPTRRATAATTPSARPPGATAITSSALSTPTSRSTSSSANSWQETSWSGPLIEKLALTDIEKLVATGFLRMAPDGTGAKDVDRKLACNQTVADTVQTVSTALFGMTMHCAQCHNHRYDPIPQADYYRLRAVFEPALDPTNWRTPAAREIALLSDADRSKAAAIEAEALAIDRERLRKQAEHIAKTFAKELAKLPAELREPIRTAFDTPAAKRTAQQQKLLRDHPSVNVTAGSLYLYDGKAAADLKTYLARATKLRATRPVPELIRALTEIPGKVPQTYVFYRGDHDQPKEAVAPAGLTVLEPLALGAIPVKNPALPTTGRRLGLARQLTSGKHPLTARVLVNRFWLHHFGRGLVGTPGDFGVLGERPTHPELLDWLATEFMEGGWRLKRLHRLLMTSTAYRQSARGDAALKTVDADNRLLGRMSVRRLEAEALRDAILAVSGKLNPKAFGPPVPVMADTVGQVVVGVDTTDGAGRPTGKVVPLNGEEFRRGVYVQVRRSKPLAFLAAFDAPVMSPCCEARNSSTAAPQALMLMNSAFVVEQSGHFARRLRREAGDDLRAQVTRGWRLAFAREPSARDVDNAVAFLVEQTEILRDRPEPQTQALATFCQALLSANEFLYVD